MKAKIVIWALVTIFLLAIPLGTINTFWASSEYEVGGAYLKEAIRKIEAFEKALKSGDPQKIQETAWLLRKNPHAVELIKNRPHLNQRLNAVAKIIPQESASTPLSSKSSDASKAPPPASSTVGKSAASAKLQQSAKGVTFNGLVEQYRKAVAAKDPIKIKETWAKLSRDYSSVEYMERHAPELAAHYRYRSNIEALNAEHRAQAARGEIIPFSEIEGEKYNQRMRQRGPHKRSVYVKNDPGLADLADPGNVHVKHRPQGPSLEAIDDRHQRILREWERQKDISTQLKPRPANSGEGKPSSDLQTRLSKQTLSDQSPVKSSTSFEKPSVSDQVVNLGRDAANYIGRKDAKLQKILYLGELPPDAGAFRRALNASVETGTKVIAFYQGGRILFYSGEALGHLAMGNTEEAREKGLSAAQGGAYLGAIVVGAGLAPTATGVYIAVEGGRYAHKTTGELLETTQLGRKVDKNAEEGIDTLLHALPEDLSNVWAEISGDETGWDKEKQEILRRQQTFLRAIRNGQIRLKDGVTSKDVALFLKTNNPADRKYTERLDGLIEYSSQTPDAGNDNPSVKRDRTWDQLYEDRSTDRHARLRTQVDVDTRYSTGMRSYGSKTLKNGLASIQPIDDHDSDDVETGVRPSVEETGGSSDGQEPDEIKGTPGSQQSGQKMEPPAPALPTTSSVTPEDIFVVFYDPAPSFILEQMMVYKIESYKKHKSDMKAQGREPNVLGKGPTKTVAIQKACDKVKKPKRWGGGCRMVAFDGDTRICIDNLKLENQKYPCGFTVE
jgi:hypothetical protein